MRFITKKTREDIFAPFRVKYRALLTLVGSLSYWPSGQCFYLKISSQHRNLIRLRSLNVRLKRYFYFLLFFFRCKIVVPMDSCNRLITKIVWIILYCKQSFPIESYVTLSTSALYCMLKCVTQCIPQSYTISFLANREKLCF